MSILIIQTRSDMIINNNRFKQLQCKDFKRETDINPTVFKVLIYTSTYNEQYEGCFFNSVQSSNNDKEILLYWEAIMDY